MPVIVKSKTLMTLSGMIEAGVSNWTGRCPGQLDTPASISRAHRGVVVLVDRGHAVEGVGSQKSATS